MPYHSIEDPRTLRRLLDAVLLIEGELSLPAVLRHITEEATSLVGARYGALGVLDEKRHSLAEFVTTGISQEVFGSIGPLPTGRGILGLLIREPKPLRLTDLRSHPDSFGFPPNHPMMKSFLGAPIRIRGEVFGNLYLTEKLESDAFSEGDEQLLVALASAAGIAIENARLHARSKEAVVVEDRDRIARDLHDTVIQRLFASGLKLQGALPAIQSSEASDRVRQTVSDLDETISQIRNTIFSLNVAPATHSTRREVTELIDEMIGPLGVEPEVRFTGPVDLLITGELAEHVLATLREALANVAKHAQAGRVTVRLAAGPDRVELEVLDNGVGLTAGEERSGHGLANLARRAQSLRGEFTVEPALGGGTRLLWTARVS